MPICLSCRHTVVAGIFSLTGPSCTRFLLQQARSGFPRSSIRRWRIVSVQHFAATCLAFMKSFAIRLSFQKLPMISPIGRLVAVVAIVVPFEWRFKQWTSRMYFDGTIVLGSFNRYVATLIRRLPLNMCPCTSLVAGSLQR